jgi:hypothetical protein
MVEVISRPAGAMSARQTQDRVAKDRIAKDGSPILGFAALEKGPGDVDLWN